MQATTGFSTVVLNWLTGLHPFPIKYFGVPPLFFWRTSRLPLRHTKQKGSAGGLAWKLLRFKGIILWFRNVRLSLSKLFFEKSDTFGVMGCIMNFDGKKIEDAARIPRYKGAKFKANTFFYSENKDDLVYTTYLSGANAIIDRKKIAELGGFNEIYSPFYFEDFDLGLRAWEMGWKLYYDHQSVCYHRVSASTNNMNKSNFVKITYNRNSFLLQSIHLNGFKRKIWHLQLFTTTLFGHLIKGDFWVFESLKAFLTMQPAIQKSILSIRELQKTKNIFLNLDDIIAIQKQNMIDKKIKWL